MNVAPPYGDYSQTWSQNGYKVQHVTPNSGDSINSMSGYSKLCVLVDAALLVALTFNFPPNPLDGDKVVFGSKGAITAFNLQGGANAVNGALAGIAANGYATYVFSADAGAWFRTG